MHEVAHHVPALVGMSQSQSHPERNKPIRREAEKYAKATTRKVVEDRCAVCEQMAW